MTMGRPTALKFNYVTKTGVVLFRAPAFGLEGGLAFDPRPPGSLLVDPGRDRPRTLGGAWVGVFGGRLGDLRGLGDVDMGLLVGGFANARYGPVMLNLSGGQDVIDGHGGALIGVRLSVALPVDDRLRVSPSFSATWASEDYMESYFGVTGAQAARSNYRPFSPSAGFKDVGLGVNAKYRIAGGWHATGMLSYKRLVGDAADSPIVEGPGGSRNQFMGLIGVAYDFSF